MGANDITEPTRTTIRATATIPQPWPLSGKRTDKAKAFRFPRCGFRSPLLRLLALSPLRVQGATKARTFARQEQQPSTRQRRSNNGHHQGKNVANSLLLFPFPLLVAGSFPLRVPEQQPRQGRSAYWLVAISLFRIPFPLCCGCWLFPLCEFQKHQGNGNHQRNGHTKDERQPTRQGRSAR